MSWFHWDGQDLILQIKVQPRARRDEFAGAIGDHLKVRITATPVDGRANEHLIDFLARQFGTPRARITLVRGHKSKLKVLRIQLPAKTPRELDISLQSYHTR
jgi:uncharacterized protein (TIGR00251 family)